MILAISSYFAFFGILYFPLRIFFAYPFSSRNLSKSTGMGLYIAKRLCDKLGHKILIESEKNEYTIVKIIFGNNDYYKIDN